MRDGLNLSTSNRTLGTHGRRFIDERLSEGLQAGLFAAPPTTGTEDERAMALNAWQQATLNEYRSQVGFTLLLSEATLEGLPFDALQTLARTVRDEAVHVELCRRMVRWLGGTDEIPGTPQWVTPDESLPRLDRIGDMVIGSLCIGESVSCFLLGAGRDEATDPTARAVLTQMTADESFHSQAGFALLEMLMPRLNAKQKRSWNRRAQLALDSVSEFCEQPFDLVWHPYGCLSFKRQRSIFRKIRDTRILPRLKTLGLPLTT